MDVIALAKRLLRGVRISILLLPIGCLVAAVCLAALALETATDLQPLPASLAADPSDLRKVQVVDRHMVPLTVTYQNRWNLHDRLPLHRMPHLLQQAVVVAEDKRFYTHRGVDWIARLHALCQNIAAGRKVRGASTISEQVVRMLHPRPRTIWSRWLEGLEASRLEHRFSKSDILEFYLNQVPYASRRRGVVQAAHHYFDRDPDTLSAAEMLALAVMVRAPGRLDLNLAGSSLQPPLRRLADRMLTMGTIAPDAHRGILSTKFRLRPPDPLTDASHFVAHLFASRPREQPPAGARMQTTLDAALQSTIQRLLDGVLARLEIRGVANGAVLVVDHRSNEILSWVNGGAQSEQTPGAWIDAVTTPRQPGSTLKPFLYAQALEKGWTASTLIDDAPVASPVSGGLHAYHNYSRVFYGPVRLREALANSLNTPAVRAIRFVGADDFLARLHALGFDSLQRHPDEYGDGLALGNGEVTLLELVRAYAVLANRGVRIPLKCLIGTDRPVEAPRRIFSEEIASLVGDILSDAHARRLEFGAGGLLQLPVQTAVKTGTSSDHRDAWAVGFDYRFAVGVWMGNLDGSASDGITGSSGPAMVLRAVFAELNRHQRTRPLYLSPRLIRTDICRDSGRAALAENCPRVAEWYLPGTGPASGPEPDQGRTDIHLVKPTNGLQLAFDPRIPEDMQALAFALNSIPASSEVRWYVDGELAATVSTADYLWPLKRGRHVISAQILPAGGGDRIDIPPATVFVR